jgi:hypothetical protein
MVMIWIELKMFASFIEADSSMIHLLSKCDLHGEIVVYFTDLANGGFQLFPRKQSNLSISLCNYIQMGHAIQVNIPMDEINCIKREEKKTGICRNWTVLWESESPR